MCIVDIRYFLQTPVRKKDNNRIKYEGYNYT